MTPEAYKKLSADLKAGKIDGKHVETVTKKLAEFEANTAAAKAK